MEPSSHALYIKLSDIEVGPRLRASDAAIVQQLVISFEESGQKTPITVRVVNGKYELVSGHHRVEAQKLRGVESILAYVLDLTDEQAKLYEASENRDRKELSYLERADHDVLVWRSRGVLVDELSQAETVTGGRGHEGGVRHAARQTGKDHNEVRRTLLVASLSPEAKIIAVEMKLDDVRSALLEAAEKQTPEAQVAKLREIAERKLERKGVRIAAARRRVSAETIVDTPSVSIAPEASDYAPEPEDVLHRAKPVERSAHNSESTQPLTRNSGDGAVPVTAPDAPGNQPVRQNDLVSSAVGMFVGIALSTTPLQRHEIRELGRILQHAGSPATETLIEIAAELLAADDTRFDAILAEAGRRRPTSPEPRRADVVPQHIDATRLSMLKPPSRHSGRQGFRTLLVKS